mmetsp:Transcript_110142/g.245800  ORF Transcript_110142/g.245800 Transcript_110142/m.245800 type:complete len:202 (-) Transcript_110142:1035-1640(-)
MCSASSLWLSNSWRRSSARACRSLWVRRQACSCFRHIRSTCMSFTSQRYSCKTRSLYLALSSFSRVRWRFSWNARRSRSWSFRRAISSASISASSSAARIFAAADGDGGDDLAATMSGTFDFLVRGWGLAAPAGLGDIGDVGVNGASADNSPASDGPAEEAVAEDRPTVAGRGRGRPADGLPGGGLAGVLSSRSALSASGP